MSKEEEDAEWKKFIAAKDEAIEAAKKEYDEGSETLADCYKAAGDIAFENEKTMKIARDDYQEALKILEKLNGKEEKLAELCARIGEIFYIGSEVEDSNKYLNLALGYMDKGKINSPLLKSRIYLWLGENTTGNEAKIKRYKETKDLAQQCIKDYKKGQWPDAVQTLGFVLNNLAVIYGRLGDTEQEFLYYEQALRVFEENHADNTKEYITTCANLGIAYANAREYAKAEPLMKKGLETAMANFGKFSYPAANCERALGLLYEYQEKYDEAEKHYQNVLEISLKIYGEKHSFTAEAYENLAYTASGKKDYEKALENAKNSLEIYKSLYGNDSAKLNLTLRILAKIYLGISDFSEAERCLLERLRVLENSDDYSRILAACWRNIKERLDDKTYDWSRLIAASVETATSAMERVRVSPSVGAIKNQLLATAAPFYYVGIGISAKNKDIKKAFDYSESVKSRGFLDQVGSEAAFSLPGISPADADALRRLDAKIEAARAEVTKLLSQEAEKRDNGRVSALTSQIEQDTKTLAALEQKMAGQNPMFAQLRNPKPATLKDAQKFCGNDKAIVEFVLWNPALADGIDKLVNEGKSNVKPGSYAIVVTKGKSFAVPLADFDYESAVSNLREKIMNLQDQAEFEAERNALYKNLFGQVLPQLPSSIKSLLIVPDGSLAFLPFDILREGKNSPELSEKYELSFSPSVSISILKGSQKTTGSGQMLAMGGAWYDAAKSAEQHKDAFSAESRGASNRAAKKPKTTVVLKTAKMDELQTRDFIEKNGAAAYFKDISLRWNDLPGTLTEVEAIEGIKKISTVKQESVTEAKVKALSASGELSKYKQLHFACHGRFDEKVPEMSGIVFSEVSQKGAAEDGYLTIPEILQMNIDSDFVCLSACETGRGRIKVGDGLTGLPRAFMVSGTKKVGVTLWCVDDAATCDFMIRLYKKIESGVPYSAAYYQVRNEFRQHNNANWRHPYFRSAFVLYE